MTKRLITQRSLVQIQPPQPNLMSRVSGRVHYVYVLWSPRARRFYIGISEDPDQKLTQHNQSSCSCSQN